MDRIALILAAGKGTRMKSDLPKPLVPFLGLPIVQYIIDSFVSAGIKEVNLVIGYGADLVREKIGEDVGYVYQLEQKGTAHAVLQAKDTIAWEGKSIIVFVGDAPLISADSIKKLAEVHEENGAACSFLTSFFDLDLPYARVIRDEKGNVAACVEELDAAKEQLEIKELLSSHFIFNSEKLFEYLPTILPHKKNGEFYLTDIIQLFIANNLLVQAVSIENYEELVGLNTPEDVVWAENIYQTKS